MLKNSKCLKISIAAAVFLLSSLNIQSSVYAHNSSGKLEEISVNKETRGPFKYSSGCEYNKDNGAAACCSMQDSALFGHSRGYCDYYKDGIKTGTAPFFKSWQDSIKRMNSGI